MTGRRGGLRVRDSSIAAADSARKKRKAKYPSPVKIHVIQALFGEALLLQFDEAGRAPTKRNWLIDGGPGNNKLLWEASKMWGNLFSTLNEEKAEFLDLLVVTHKDGDHLVGILLLLVSVFSLPNSIVYHL